MQNGITFTKGRLTNRFFHAKRPLDAWGWGVLQVDALKKSAKIDFWQNKFLKFSCYSQPSRLYDGISFQYFLCRENQLQEEFTPKICLMLSKLKINRPIKVGSDFVSVLVKKIDFGGWALWRGRWGSGNSAQKTLCMKKIDLWVFPNKSTLPCNISLLVICIFSPIFSQSSILMSVFGQY